MKEEDAGSYECRPSNVIGQGTSSRSKVTVLKGVHHHHHPSSSSSVVPIESSKLLGTRPANGNNIKDRIEKKKGRNATLDVLTSVILPSALLKRDKKGHRQKKEQNKLEMDR